MAYKKTIWKNRVVERPRTFRKTDNPDGTITLEPEEGEVLEPGTPIVAQNMNNIENKLEELDLKQTVMSQDEPQAILGTTWIHTI